MEKIRDGKTGRFEEDGRVSYYKDGLLHREDGPAREFATGDKLWFLNDKPHRVDGPAHDRADGVKIWFFNGELHRDDGPAYEHPNGRKKWYSKGKLHRVDGPAVEDPYSGDEWWFDDVQYASEKDFPGDRVKIIQKALSILDEKQLNQVANIVHQMISLRRSPEPSDSPKPKI